MPKSRLPPKKVQDFKVCTTDEQLWGLLTMLRLMGECGQVPLTVWYSLTVPRLTSLFCFLCSWLLSARVDARVSILICLSSPCLSFVCVCVFTESQSQSRQEGTCGVQQHKHQVQNERHAIRSCCLFRRLFAFVPLPVCVLADLLTLSDAASSVSRSCSCTSSCLCEALVISRSAACILAFFFLVAVHMCALFTLSRITSQHAVLFPLSAPVLSQDQLFCLLSLHHSDCFNPPFPLVSFSVAHVLLTPISPGFWSSRSVLLFYFTHMRFACFQFRYLFPAIVMPEQTVVAQKTEPITSRHLSLTDLRGRTKHYNVTMRKG